VAPLYLDEDSMDRGPIDGLRAGGVDVVTAGEAGRLGAADEEHLAFAASQSRVLCTANVADFAPLHARWLRAGRRHPGIVIILRHRMPVGTQIRALLGLAQALSPEDMEGRVEYLRNWAR
jgi:hypothetical protein